MIRTINPSIIAHINSLLNTKEKQVECEVENEVEDNTTDESDNESDDEYSKKQVEEYIPKKISFLTIADDNYEQKIVKRDNPIINGMCPCGGRITPSNKARHLRSYRHILYLDQLSKQ